MELPRISDKANSAIQIGIENGDYLVDLELLSVSQRLINLLEGAGIITLSDLMHKEPADLMSIKNFGKKATLQVFSALSRYDELEDLKTIKPIE